MRVAIVKSDGNELEIVNDFTLSIQDIRAVVGADFRLLTLLVEDNGSALHLYHREDVRGVLSEPNLAIIQKEGLKLLDVVHGNVVFIRTTPQGDEVSITEKDIAFLKERLFFYQDGKSLGPYLRKCYIIDL